ncbi:ABC transporter substrate-binding protein [Candidatus Venteria ishoeyi]|uniref:ABC transporter substrate-binding protein n=1 Tax=Candidatus Venteria ishoeyi TaxID=1899563 RepID=UPI0025A50395|nr:ABC transporter substrate-binding protein [Candidatus Venteria ishoeyi]MDM8545633.1 ABC transporter substrate-binding protein [Candidatus Venteria ishoeyi]
MKITTYFNALCAFMLLATTTAVSAKTTLKVGYLPILDHLTLLVSHVQDNKNFQQVDIKPKLFKSWGAMTGALKAEVIDAAFILSPLAMDTFNKGSNIRAILLAHRDGSAITIKKGANIHSAADLKGKKVAIPYRISTHTALLNQYLSNDGLSLKDIKTRIIAPPDMIKAMHIGVIDAFIVAEPFGTKAQNQGLGEIMKLTKDIVPNHVECIVVVREEVLQQSPAAVEEWVASLIRAGQFIDQDKLENGSKAVAQMTAKKYWPYNKKDIISGLQNPSDRISFSDLKPDKADFQTIVDISIDSNILDKVDLNRFIEPRFYQKAVTAESAN